MEKLKTVRKWFLQALPLLALTVVPVDAGAQKLQWCLKTDQGQYIEMARVEMLVAVDGQSTFEVVVRKGEGAVGVKSITFERHESDFKPSEAFKPDVITEKGPWCLITDKGDSIAMSRVQMMAKVDGSQFEVVTTDGNNCTGVSSLRFGRGKSMTSGGFIKIDPTKPKPEDPHAGNPWCMITDKGDSIAMSRVQMIAHVDGSNCFEVVVSDGANVSGAQSVHFAHGNSKTSGGFVKINPEDDPVTPPGNGPWCLITDKGDSIAMSRVQLLAHVDNDGLFEIVTRSGEGATGVKSVRFARGLSQNSGGFIPYQEEEEEPGLPPLSAPLYLVTDKGDEQPLRNVAMLANIDADGHFEVVLHQGSNLTGVEHVTFHIGSVDTGISNNHADNMLQLLTPVHSQLRLSGCGAVLQAFVYDINGAQVATAPVVDGTTTITVAHLPAATYIVRVGGKALKFIKK